MTSIKNGSTADKRTDQLMKIYGLQSIDGGSVESLNFHNYPEFDDRDLYKSSGRQPSPSAMAPTTIIETVTITRPLKVLSFLSGVAVFIFMLVAVTSTDWIILDSARMGLFTYCIAFDPAEKTANLPAAFKIPEEPGCLDTLDRFYIKAASILCVICFLANALATLLTGLGLKSEDAKYKYKFYRLSVLVMIIALASLLAGLIVYPWKFGEEFPEEEWEIGWAFIMGWIASVFLSLALLLLLCDKESEELFYKERKIVHENGNGNAAE